MRTTSIRTTAFLKNIASTKLKSATTQSSNNNDSDLRSEGYSFDEIKEKGGTRKRPKKPNQAKRERPRIPVLQYHDDWVCVCKPAGLTVHRSANTPRRQLVLSTLLKRQLSRKVFPVHRLDHRTSGAILFAFDSKTCALLHQALTFHDKSEQSNDGRKIEGKQEEQLDDTSISDESVDENGNPIRIDDVQGSRKEYIALLRGDWKRKFGDQEEIVVTKSLNVKGIIKDAKTVFRILASSSGTSRSMKKDSFAGDRNEEIPEYYSPAACSLVLCTPLTGRTHQIRRHAYAMDMPIIGDSEHGDSKINRWWRENRDLNRLFLHCFNLDLPPLKLMEYLNDCGACDEGEVIGDGGQSRETLSELFHNRVVCTAPLTEDLTKVLKSEALVDIWEVARNKDTRLNLIPFDDRGGTFGRNYRKKK